MRETAWAIALLTLLAAPAAALPDLKVELQLAQVPGSKKANVFITITNVGDAPADPASSVLGFIDVLFFANAATQPQSDSSAPDYAEVPWQNTVLAAGDSYVTSTVWDYEIVGTYQAWAMVDSISFVNEGWGITETTKTNNVVGPVPITIGGDVAVTDLALSAATAEVTGQTVTLSVTVQNLGTENVDQPFNVDVLFDAQTCPPAAWQIPSPTVFGDIFKKVDGLAKSATTVVKLSGKPGPGSHLACVALDLDGSVAEASEANNFFGPVAFTVDAIPDPEQPDLAVKSFKVQALGAQVSYTPEVKNTGTAPSGPTTVDIYYNSFSKPAPLEEGDFVFQVPALQPGETWSDTHVRSSAPNGTYQAWMWIDRHATVEEKDEANNVEGPYEYQVLVAGALPNLEVVEVRSTVLVDRIHYEVDVKNSGNATAKAVDVDFFFSLPGNPDCVTGTSELADAPQQYQQVDQLEPGNLITLDFFWVLPPDGPHSGWVKLDCLGNVPESDETDNDYGPVNVEFLFVPPEGADILVTSFQAKVDCTRITYIVVFRNIGDEAIGAFQVDIFKDRPTNPGYGNPGDLSFFYQSLAPGQEVILERVVEEVPSGTYESWVVTDTLLQADEVDEGNNIAGKLQVVVDAASCVCPKNTAITEACACGTATFFEGHCCNDQWSFEAFPTCQDSGGTGGDATDNPGDSDATGGADGDGGTGGGSGGPDAGGLPGGVQADARGGLVSISETSGCRASGRPALPGAAALALLLLLGALRSRSRGGAV